jgi:hypothetical protein
VDDIWVQGLPLWGQLSTTTTSPVPHGTSALQLSVIQAPSTIWAGTVTHFSPALRLLTGWFVDPYRDWFGGNRYGTTKIMDWFVNPATSQSAWFSLNGNYFGLPNSWMGGNWFPQPIVSQTANLVGFKAFPAQWLNFSIYAQFLSGQPSDAEMQFGFRWYFADNTSVEQVMIQSIEGRWQPQPYKSVLLTNGLLRYDVASQAPFEPLTGDPPVLVFVYCRFPHGQPGDLFLLNSALLAMGATAPPFDDATLHPGSPDWVIDQRGASFYYRRRAPRTARLRAEMYRWIPMGATYSLEFGSTMTEPPYDPTMWPP